MTTYRYSGMLADGGEVHGTLKAGNESDLEFRLVNQGIFLTSCRPVIGSFRLALTRFFKRSEITRITRQMGVLLSSEISIVETFQLVREQISDSALAAITDNIIQQVEAGKSVASALAEYPTIFDPLYISMVDAGELSGDLAVAFNRIADYREKYETTVRKVKSALAYPFLVILVAVVVAMALVLYVVPVFSSMYENFGAELPALTQTVVNISSFLRSTIWYWLLLGLVAVVALGYVASTSRARNAAHKLMVRIPLAKNLTIRIISARFCRTMGALLTSGVDIIRALRISSRTTGNFYVNARLEPAELALAQGKSFTEAVASSAVFPRAMLRLTASGEKTGRLGEMLERAADYYDRETEVEISTLTALIEPIIILILGAFVAFILIAMYLPLFDLVGTI